MDYTISCSEGFRISAEESVLQPDVTLLTVCAERETPARLDLEVVWFRPAVAVHALWSPLRYDKYVLPEWLDDVKSCATRSAPILCGLSYDDTNRQTLACSEVKYAVELQCGIREETAELHNRVRITVDREVSAYTAQIRIDTRAIPFYRVVDDVRRWWESFEGNTPAFVPALAREPLYSAWYSFHQNIDVPAIVDQCRYFAGQGCRVLIVDDGWETDSTARGFDFTGDWEPTPEKVPDMKAFVDAVHETGMKFMLWYSVSFVGKTTKAYKRFEDKMLGLNRGETYTFDPRYPEVREYLIQTYKDAMRNWGLDGFKLDFVDEFHRSDVVKEGMDYVSVLDATDRLMKDVIRELQALNPDVLLEFRREYSGPLMRTYGNMFRSSDCPVDCFTNRLNSLSMRMLCGRSPVHSDMVMWHRDETAEQAAFQLTNVLFDVPQISVRYEEISEPQRRMVKSYLDFWLHYREVLLDGEMLYKNYAASFTYVSSRKGQTQVGAVYAGQIACLEEPTDEIVLVNASLDQRILLDSRFDGHYTYTIENCCGEKTGEGRVSFTADGLDGCIRDVPVNGRVKMTRMKE